MHVETEPEPRSEPEPQAEEPESQPTAEPQVPEPEPEAQRQVVPEPEPQPESEPKDDTQPPMSQETQQENGDDKGADSEHVPEVKSIRESEEHTAEGNGEKTAPEPVEEVATSSLVPAYDESSAQEDSKQE